MAISEEQALKETFIQIHDFLLARSCKKAAASLVKEAPAAIGLKERSPQASTSKLVDIVKSHLLTTKASSDNAADSSSDDDSDSDSEESSSSESEDEVQPKKSAPQKGKFSAVPPPSAGKANVTAPIKAQTSPSSSSSSSESDSNSESSDDDATSTKNTKTPVKAGNATGAASSSASTESVTLDNQSDSSSSSDDSSDSSSSEDDAPVKNVKAAVKKPVETAKAASAKVAKVLAKQKEESSDSSSSDSDSSSESESDSSSESSAADVAKLLPENLTAVAAGPFTGFAKAAQSAVGQVVQATLPHSEPKAKTNKKRKAASSSSSSSSSSDSSSDSSSSSSSSEDEKPAKKKVQIAKGAVTKSTTVVQIPAGEAGTVQVSKKVERQQPATPDSAPTSGTSTPINGMNAERAALLGLASGSNSPAPQSRGSPAVGKKGQNVPFRRVKVEDHVVDTRLVDNSFTGKAGAHEKDYGWKAAQDLIVTRGDSFRKEKNKKKRGSYRGGEITMQSHSIKFDD